MNRYLSACIMFLHLLSTGCEKDQLIFDEIIFDSSSYILPDYFVTAIDFDSKGNAWIGTFKQGLIKYDGQSATIFNHKNSNFPDSNAIWDLKVDHNDNVWIGAYGLIRFDGESSVIYNTSNSPLLEDVVWSVGIDEDNIVWIASCRFREGGLMSFDGINWESYTPENSPLPANSVRDIVIDNYNNVWLAISETVNRSCLVKIRNGEWKVYDHSDFGFQPYCFRNIAVGKNNIIIASIDYSLSSSIHSTGPYIILFDGKKCTIKNPEDEQGNIMGVGEVTTDRKGNIWASVSWNTAKIAVYNGQKWFFHDIDTYSGSVFTIESDQKGRIWIGTSSGIHIIEQD